MNTYPRAYIAHCRATVDRQVAEYAKLASPTKLFEQLFFQHMLLALDAYACHRSRTVEGKDGNPLNEVRVLCASIMQNGGKMSMDKAIKLQPEASVLGLREGDEIALTIAGFSKLSKAFFDELERKFAA